MSTWRPIARSSWLVALAMLAGCAASEPSRFYTLSPQVPAAEATAASPRPLDAARGNVALSPVQVPRYLDRPQLVTRTDANTLRLSEFDKWSEPLADMIGRVLSEDLARRLPHQRVFVLPVRQAVPIDRIVDVQILRFDADASGLVTLDARWQVFADAGRSLLAARDSVVRETASGAGEAATVAATVAAMSRALSRLSADIAATLSGNRDGNVSLSRAP